MAYLVPRQPQRPNRQRRPHSIRPELHRCAARLVRQVHSQRRKDAVRALRSGQAAAATAAAVAAASG